MKLSRLSLCGIVIWCALESIQTNANARDLKVDMTRDDVTAVACTDAPDDCSLRGAIIAANSKYDEDTILLKDETYTLSIGGKNEDFAESGDLDISGPVTIVGMGIDKTTIVGRKGQGKERITDGVFDVHTVSVVYQEGIRSNRSSQVATIDSCPQTVRDGADVIISDLRIINGESTSGGALRVASSGPGLSSSNTALCNVSLENNFANDGRGGAIRNSGRLVLAMSNISLNKADIHGGGIYNDSGASIEIDQVIISDNTATAGGGVFNEGKITLRNVTVDNNHATGGYSSDGSLQVRERISGGGILNTETGEVDINDSIIINNDAANSGGGIANGRRGLNRGLGIISNTTISDNRSEQSAGGIYNGGYLSITRSTLNNNMAAIDGGAVVNSFTTTVTNSTVSKNTARRNGGGIYDSADSMGLLNVTITRNFSDSDSTGDGSGGGMFTITPTYVGLVETRAVQDKGDSKIGFEKPFVRNTIIANNTDLSGKAPDCAGPLFSPSYNLIGDASGCSIDRDAIGNIVGQDPQLDDLASNTVAVQTHALLCGSPAVDAGGCVDQNGVLFVTVDQRNIERPVDGNGDSRAVCDIGAFELIPTPLTLSVESSTPPEVTLGTPLTYSFTVTNKGSSPAKAVMTDLKLPATVAIEADAKPQECQLTGDMITCDLGTLEPSPDPKSSRTVTVTVTPTEPGLLTSPVTVSGLGCKRDPEKTTIVIQTEVRFPEQARSASRTLPSLGNGLPPSADPRLAYVLIGSPLQLDPADPLKVLQSHLGRPGRGLWRMFRFDTVEDDYQEFNPKKQKQQNELFAFLPGRGYWLIARNGGTVVVNGTPNSPSQPFSIPLQPGFNQIATPFNFVPTSTFALAWDACLVDKQPAQIKPVLFSFEKDDGSYQPKETLTPTAIPACLYRPVKWGWARRSSCALVSCGDASSQKSHFRSYC